ncbi:hypothetical protein [Acinetobacter soli]|uniref:hypothetical protein n=1 Tax=Acinetobacter soli TaxID=487316 RepID=UPI001250B459|nr:hypothetical protein [Acinetobacter soli]
MTEKPLIANLIKNQNRKQSFKQSKSGLATASMIIIISGMSFFGMKGCANDADFQAQKAKAYQAQFAGDQK